MKRRVVITGFGYCSPLGNADDVVIDALHTGRSGVEVIDAWRAFGHLRSLVAAPVRDVDFKLYARKRVRTMGRVALLAAFASDRAVSEAGLDAALLGSGRVGVAYGSTHGSSSVMESYCRSVFGTESFRSVGGSDFLKFMSHTCAANLAEFFGIRGRVQPTCSACTSGSQGIGVGYELVKHGQQDVVLVGGAEELHVTHAGVFDVMFAASTRYTDTPDCTPRPFDASRDGVVIGEGAGALVLEELEHARARGAESKIIAELVGYANVCDGLHLTKPDADGMANCMRLALDDAGLEPAAIDYVNAHGTATELGDIAESQATFAVFGDRVPVSTQKGQMGHTLGACGALETIFGLLMMREGFIAPNRNLDEVDARCAPLDFVRGGPRSAQLEHVMFNNFAFGGIDTSLVVRRWSGR